MIPRSGEEIHKPVHQALVMGNFLHTIVTKRPRNLRAPFKPGTLPMLCECA